MRTRYWTVGGLVSICTAAVLSFQNCAESQLPDSVQNFNSIASSPPSISVQSMQVAPGASINLTVNLVNIKKSYTLNWQLTPNDGNFDGPVSGTLSIVPAQSSVTVNLKNKALLGSGSKSYSITVSSVEPELASATGTVQVLDTGVPSSLTASYLASCASINGVAKCWGYNAYGELSTTDQPNGHKTPQAVLGLSGPVSKIVHSVHETCAIVSEALYCWGLNNYGQLGDGTTGSRRTPRVVPGLEAGVTDVSIGYNHACAIKDGRLFCWGLNNYGQVGASGGGYRSAPFEVSALGSSVTSVAAGQNFTCAIAGGGVRCWGLNNLGQLADGSNQNSITPVDVAGASSGATALATGSNHACAIVNGGVRCWGYNAYNQLGDGSGVNRSAAVSVNGLNSGALKLALGDLHSCALVNDVVSCWGYISTVTGADGRSYGYGANPAPITGLRPGTINIASGLANAAGASHICAMSILNEIQCWGPNAYGQLGDGTVNNRSSPGTPISF